MKKLNKFTPFLLASAITLTGCSSTNVAQLSNGEENIQINNIGEDIKTLTYQEIYDLAYASSGNSYAFNQLLFQISSKVIAENSDYYTEAYIQEQIVDFYDALFESKDPKDESKYQYQTNGVFNEEILVTNVRTDGYKVVCKDGYFKGSAGDLTNDSLYESLKCDYSDFTKRYFIPAIYEQILKEEYILAEKNGLFSTKKVRNVEVVKFTASDAEVASKYTDLFLELIEEAVANEGENFDFENLVTKEGGINDIWKAQLMDQLDKDFAVINYKRQPGDKYYDLYIPEDEISTLKTERLATFSGNNAHSIFYGYNLEVKEIEKTNLYASQAITVDDAPFSDAINNILFDSNANVPLEKGFLVSPSSGTILLNINGSYTFMKVTLLDSNSSLEERREAAKAFTANSTIMKNYIQYYLEKYNIEIHDQNLYDFLVVNEYIEEE